MRTCYQRKQTYSFNSGARAAPQLWLAGCVDSSQLCPGARPASSYSYTSVTHSQAAGAAGAAWTVVPQKVPSEGS